MGRTKGVFERGGCTGSVAVINHFMKHLKSNPVRTYTHVKLYVIYPLKLYVYVTGVSNNNYNTD